jgi:Subunit 17 of Mediator complex
MESSTTTATETGAVTLRSWPHGNKNTQRSISKLIERINKQEGSFRNITEESAEETIRREGPGAQPGESTEKGEGGQDEKSRKESAIEAKAEIIKLATYGSKVDLGDNAVR